jgi:tetratricopeptide (TPR) repeat protein
MARTLPLMFLMTLAPTIAGCTSDRGRDARPLVPAPTAPRLIPLSTSSETARAAFQRGEELLFAGKLAQSRPHFEAAIAADPELAQAHFNLGGSSGGEERKAHIAKARELARALPEVERLWIETGWAGSSGDPSAGELAARVVALAPDDWRAHWYQGSIAHFHRGEFATARAAYERAIRLAPARATPYGGYISALVALGDLAAASTAAARLVALSPGEAAPLDTQGEVLLRAGKLEEAERAFRAAVATDPAHRSEDGIAMVQLYRGDTAAAADWLRRALNKRGGDLASTNEDYIVRAGLGRSLVWTYLVAGDLDRADAAVAEAEASLVAGGATHAALRVQEMRAEVLAERKRWAEAARVADEAIASARALATWSRILRELGLLRIRIAIRSGDTAAAGRLGEAFLTDRADDAYAKVGRLLMAYHRRDLAAVLAAVEELRGEDEAQAEGKLFAAELLASAGDRERATQLRREVASVYSRSTQAFVYRRLAERALASPDRGR